jgi:Rod binding domain-containing protein
MLDSSPASGGAAIDKALEAKVKSVAAEFESMILGQLLQPMFESLDSDGMFGGGSGERMFRPMLVEEYAKGLAKAGGIGLSEPLANEIIRLQTMQNQPAAGAA